MGDNGFTVRHRFTCPETANKCPCCALLCTCTGFTAGDRGVPCLVWPDRSPGEMWCPRHPDWKVAGVPGPREPHVYGRHPSCKCCHADPRSRHHQKTGNHYQLCADAFSRALQLATTPRPPQGSGSMALPSTGVVIPPLDFHRSQVVGESAASVPPAPLAPVSTTALEWSRADESEPVQAAAHARSFIERFARQAWGPSPTGAVQPDPSPLPAYLSRDPWERLTGPPPAPGPA